MYIPSRCGPYSTINLIECSKCGRFMPCHIINGKAVCIECEGLIK